MGDQNVYEGEFKSWADVKWNLEITRDEPDAVYAGYETPDYEGYATVVFRDGDKWFRASGSHCSCFGLEGQWEPEQFDPNTHFQAKAEGKRYIGGLSGFDNEAFDAWLAAQTSLPPPPNTGKGDGV